MIRAWADGFHFLLNCFIVNFSIGLLIIPQVQAGGIKPDRTLPENSSVVQQGNRYRLEGGTREGHNLFHSFEEFSIRNGAIVDFINGDATNIFTRVTGRDRSRINGMIRTQGSANLFLINPNGISFGSNALLKVGGSFFASTAESIIFRGGFEFNAINPQVSSQLTINTPLGLQFGQNPGEIRNEARAKFDKDDFPISGAGGLEVDSGNTLALIGGEVNFVHGAALAFDGRIELGAVGNDFPTQVGLTQRGNTWTLNYRSTQNLQGIQFSQNSLVDTSGNRGGRIRIRGQNINLIEGSDLFSETQGSGRGQGIAVAATNSITLQDSANIATFAAGEGRAGNIVMFAERLIQLTGANPHIGPTAVGSQVENSSSEFAAGGNVHIETRHLNIQNGAAIEASTFGRGRAGNISIRANSIDLSGATVYGINDRQEILSLISAKVGDSNGEAIENIGNAGNITIYTNQLTISEGGQISSSGRDQGQGGNVDIHAAESIRISGSAPRAVPAYDRSGIFVSSEDSSTGGITTANAGRMTLVTPELIVEGGSGNFGGEISANNFGSGKGGRITINTDRLIVRDGGIIRATSIPEAPEGEQAGGLGQAGDVVIQADSIFLNGGQINTETGAGQQPNANIRLEDFDLLLLQNESQISARAIQEASGGNINLQAPNGYLMAGSNQNNDVIANAKKGPGGEINVNTRAVVGLEERLSNPPNITNDLDASSENGPQGTVTTTQPNINPTQGLIELPNNIVDASNLIVQTCPTGSSTANSDRLSEFVITGRGGLPPSPSDPRDEDAILSGWASLETPEAARSNIENTNTERQPDEEPNQVGSIVEAQGWVRDRNGQVVLLAQAPTVAPQVSNGSMSCQARRSQSASTSAMRQ